MKVNVKEAIASKNKKLAKRLPGFVIRWIEKIVHQDDMNRFLEKHGNEDAFEFAKNTRKVAAGVSYKIINEENIPETGRYIVASNHPLGGLDGVIMIEILGNYRKNVKVPANDLIMQLEPLHSVLIPINKHGRSTKEFSLMINDVFESDDIILYFPAGLVSRKNKGILEDPPWKKTVITKSKQYQRDIIPVFFKAENSKLFYRVARWRKRLRIKFKIEMILLPSELFKQKGKEFTVTFGKPIPYTTFTNEKTDQEWAFWLKEQVYKMNNK